MMRQEAKKAQEREVLSRFAEANPHLAISEIEDSESPDFICTTNQGRCGIEVVHFLFDSERAGRSLEVQQYRERFQQELLDEHRRRELPPMHVWVRLLRHEKLLDRSFRQELKASLLNIVAEKVLVGETGVRIKGEDLSESLYDSGVCSISVVSGPAFTQSLWSFPHTTWVPASTSDHVQFIIDKKDPKVSAYRLRTETVWLLIAAGPLGLQSVIEGTDSVLNAVYSTAFDRLFLYRTFGSHSHELRKQPKITQSKR